MDETTDLLRLCIRAFALQIADAPGAELTMTRDGILALTSEPDADYNRITLAPGPDAEAFLVRAVARAREWGHPLVATMAPETAEALGPVLTRLGLTHVGGAPLMVLHPTAPLQAPRALRFTRALGPGLVRIAGDLAAAAFGSPRDQIARMIDSTVTETAGFETWLAFDGDTPVSAVTVTRTGDAAGISLMSTPPELQRRGYGQSVLTQAINAYRAGGVTRFHLGATDAGKPLYDKVGFRTVTLLSAWLLN